MLMLSKRSPRRFRPTETPKTRPRCAQAENSNMLKLRLERFRADAQARVSMWLSYAEDNETRGSFRCFADVSAREENDYDSLIAAKRRHREVHRAGSTGCTLFQGPEVKPQIYGKASGAAPKTDDERKPATIASPFQHSRVSDVWPRRRAKLESTLGPEHTKRIVRAENLALEYVSIRLPEMLPVYRRMMETVHSLIGRAFSNEVITPGKTTNQEVIWWLRQQVNNLGFGTWFHPSLRVQKPSKTGVNLLAEEARVPRAGDVLHVAFA